MRILFVCTDADIGGAERLLATLAKNWPQTDTLRLVVLMTPGTLSTQLEDAFDEVRYLGFPPTSRNLLGMVRKLNAQITEFQPDLISSHLFHADLVTALSLTRVPKVTTVHTHGLGSDDHWLTRIIARGVGALSFRFAAVVPSSDNSSMEGFLSRLRMRNVRPAILNGAAIAAQPLFDPTSRTIVSIARNHPVKGHSVLIEAFTRAVRLHPQWRLRAFGPGVVPDDESMREAMQKAQAQDLLKSGIMTLEGPTAEPESALAEASALVISSLYGESMPIVGAEAAGLGIPVITTEVGNCAEFADDQRFLVAPGSVEELTRALEIFMSLSDDERLALSRTARERAEERYRPDAVAENYQALFTELIHSDR